MLCIQLGLVSSQAQLIDVSAQADTVYLSTRVVILCLNRLTPIFTALTRLSSDLCTSLQITVICGFAVCISQRIAELCVLCIYFIPQRVLVVFMITGIFLLVGEVFRMLFRGIEVLIN